MQMYAAYIGLSWTHTNNGASHVGTRESRVQDLPRILDIDLRFGFDQSFLLGELPVDQLE